LLRKFLRNYQDYGLQVSLRKSLQYLMKPFYRNITYRIYRVDLTAVPAQKSGDSTLQFRLITRDDVGLIRQIEAMTEWLEGKVADLIASEGLCLAALDNDTVAGFNLVTFREGCLLLLDYNRKLKSNEAWSQQITVHSAYRRLGLGTELRYRVFEELRKRGFKKMYGGTRIDNKANLGLTRKTGFREIADVNYFRLFQRSKLRFKRV